MELYNSVKGVIIMKLITKNDFAAKTAVELAKLNIEQSNQWVPAETVISFMNEIYTSMTSSEE